MIMILGNAELYKNRSYNSTSSLNIQNNDRSFFIEALDMMRDSNRIINESIKTYYKDTVLNEYSVITESGIKDIMANMIDLFIDVIKKLFNKFKATVYRIFDMDKGIKKYEPSIRTMKGEFQLSFPRYNYTYLEDNIPRMDIKTQLSPEYDELIKRFDEVSKLKTVGERISKLQSIESDNNYEYDTDKYDHIRGSVLGLKKAVSESQYTETLFNTFRDGGEQFINTINNTEVNIIFDRFSNAKQMMKSVEKSKAQVIKDAEDLKKQIKLIDPKRFSTTYAKNHGADKREDALFDSILRMKSAQVSSVCEIYTMAFSAKLDAVKESMHQDRKILYVAIDYINRLEYGR